jgi:hypothetical protein
MQIEITYKKNADVDAPCIAQTEVRGECLCSIGRTWEQAKERLMEKLNSYLNATAPAPETVEVKVAGEEMETEFFAFDARTIEAGKV